jgi:molecular chaperone GrpE
MKEKNHKQRDKEAEPKTDRLKEEPKAAEKKENYEELWDRHLRLQADYDNYRKRSFKEKAEFIRYANESLIMELISILDNFELGIKAAEKKHSFDLLHQGVDMISKQLHSLLEGKGLKRIKAVGEKFDPHFHEPLDVVEDETVQEDTVCEELQPGYILNERVIRPAKVKVARGKQENAGEAAGSDQLPQDESKSQEAGQNQEEAGKVEAEDPDKSVE